MTNIQPLHGFFHPHLFPDSPLPRIQHENDGDERELVAMLTAYRPAGGVTNGDDLAAILRDHHTQPISVVARWLVRRCILSFSWRGQTLIPLFQFDRGTMCPRPDILAVIRELTDAFSDWEVALWFATPNSWLEHARPVTAVRHDPESVLRAAQADRYIALG